MRFSVQFSALDKNKDCEPDYKNCHTLRTVKEKKADGVTKIRENVPYPNAGTLMGQGYDDHTNDNYSRFL
jgi:hypothetical protein